MAPAGYSGEIAVLEGPRLLSGVGAGRPAWRSTGSPGRRPPIVTAAALIADVRKVRLLGRGGASSRSPAS